MTACIFRRTGDRGLVEGLGGSVLHAETLLWLRALQGAQNPTRDPVP